MTAHDVPPGVRARYDQIAAESCDQLSDWAGLARAHLTFNECPETACAGAAVADEIGRTCRHCRDHLLYFAVGELARLGYGTPAPYPTPPTERGQR